MQLASSQSSCVALPNLAWSRETHTLRHASSEKCQASHLTTSHCVSTSHLCSRLPAGSITALSPAQVSRRFRPNWHRKVNAHSRFLHSFPNRIQCKKTAKAALRNSYLLASAREAGSSACTVAPEQACCPDVLTLTRMLGYGSDSEEIRLSYSSLERSSCVFNMKHSYSKIQSQDFLDSVFTHF